MSLAPIPSSPRELRTSTIKSRLEHVEKGTSLPHRKELGTIHTPSLVRAPGHDCTTVDKNHTILKVSLRVYTFFLRLCVSKHFASTWRGKTEFTGHSSKCGGCHGCHAAVTPKLHDNILNGKYIPQINDKGISPRKKQYLINVLNLSEKDFSELEKHKGDLDWIKKFFAQRVSASDHCSSFRHTSLDLLLNTTFDSPIESNNIDSRFEEVMRPIEDDVNKQCFEEKVSPIEGTDLLIDESIDFLEKTQDPLKQREADLREFFDLNDKIDSFIKSKKELYQQAVQLEKKASDIALITPKSPEISKLMNESAELQKLELEHTDAIFSEFLKNLDSFLEVSNKVEKKVKNIKTFHETKEIRCDFTILHALHKSYLCSISDKTDLSKTLSIFRNSIRSLNTSNLSRKDEFLNKFKLYREETEIQLEAFKSLKANKATSDIAERAFGWGTNPTDEDIYLHLIAMTAKVDLTKPRRTPLSPNPKTPPKEIKIAIAKSEAKPVKLSREEMSSPEKEKITPPPKRQTPFKGVAAKRLNLDSK